MSTHVKQCGPSDGRTAVFTRSKPESDVRAESEVSGKHHAWSGHLASPKSHDADLDCGSDSRAGCSAWKDAAGNRLLRIWRAEKP